MQGLEYDEAAKRLWILDAKGLITKHRPAEELSDVQRPFAAVGDDDKEGENLLDVVKRVSCSKLFCEGGFPATIGACQTYLPLVSPCSQHWRFVLVIGRTHQCYGLDYKQYIRRESV